MYIIGERIIGERTIAVRTMMTIPPAGDNINSHIDILDQPKMQSSNHKITPIITDAHPMAFVKSSYIFTSFIY